MEDASFRRRRGAMAGDVLKNEGGSAQGEKAGEFWEQGEGLGLRCGGRG